MKPSFQLAFAAIALASASLVPLNAASALPFTSPASTGTSSLVHDAAWGCGPGWRRIHGDVACRFVVRATAGAVLAGMKAMATAGAVLVGMKAMATAGAGRAGAGRAGTVLARAEDTATEGAATGTTD